ncbi:MAG: GNAT family N-acetyltransferase [Myxococcales bacterium]|nr:GNAT family N-acetyltransferase [Myxococcales bacterium]
MDASPGAATAERGVSGGERGVSVRALAPGDLDAVVDLDRRITGGARRAYFERRLAVAQADPTGHVQFGLAAGAELRGFALGRLGGGEFGGRAPSLVLEAVGVEPGLQGQGLGRVLVDALAERARARSAQTLVTQADWRDNRMLPFLARAGFALGPRMLLERRVQRMPLAATEEEFERPPPLIRHLRASDLPMIARIDARITGEDRARYLAKKVDAALRESAIVVSLVAEDDGFVVAFAMARVDLGDFGHVGPTGSLDTIGVNPDVAGRGFARALLAQLLDNLAALHVEALETEVARESFELLRFLYRFGFGASPRLSFSRAL